MKITFLSVMISNISPRMGKTNAKERKVWGFRVVEEQAAYWSRKFQLRAVGKQKVFGVPSETAGACDSDHSSPVKSPAEVLSRRNVFSKKQGRFWILLKYGALLILTKWQNTGKALVITRSSLRN